jgi:hypothetical protein
MIGFIGTSLQLQSIMTAHTQWLSKACSIVFWTTSVFSSTMTNDESLLTHWTPTECRIKKNLWRIFDWSLLLLEFTNELRFITATWPEYKSPCRTVNCPLLFCVVTGMLLLTFVAAETYVWVPLPSKLTSSSADIPAFRPYLLSRCLSMTYSVTILMINAAHILVYTCTHIYKVYSVKEGSR